MGIRMDQEIGLNEWATRFVEGEPVLVCTEEVVRIYPGGRREELEPRSVYESSIKKDQSGQFYSGMFDHEYPLYMYTFPDGRVYMEGVQAQPWSSGPCFFLALRDEEGWVKESLWSDGQIENAL